MNLRSFVYRVARKVGFDSRISFGLFSLLDVTRWFSCDFSEFMDQRGSDNLFRLGDTKPCFDDRMDQGGTMNGAYFHQDLLVARLIHAANPRVHVDIGSRTDGFVAHVASFREVELIDIRPIKSDVRNIKFRQADLMNLLEGFKSSTDSISSLHAIEHFGLGRYGDPIDYWGYLKALDNIYEMLQPGGTFYFSVPIGPQRIEFNAHRVFSVRYLLDLLSQKYILVSMSIINDAGNLFEDVDISEEQITVNYGCHYGCGVFVLSKK